MFLLIRNWIHAKEIDPPARESMCHIAGDAADSERIRTKSAGTVSVLRTRLPKWVEVISGKLERPISCRWPVVVAAPVRVYSETPQHEATAELGKRTRGDIVALVPCCPSAIQYVTATHRTGIPFWPIS